MSSPSATAKTFQQVGALPFRRVPTGVQVLLVTSRGTKRWARDGDEFILPDGTRVPADEKGGFRLPNGEYVAALVDGLLLPNGVRCPEDDEGGYLCQRVQWICGRRHAA